MLRRCNTIRATIFRRCYTIKAARCEENSSFIIHELSYTKRNLKKKTLVDNYEKDSR